MDVRDRLIAAMKTLRESDRDLAEAVTSAGVEVSHSTVNRWRRGKIPRLDEAGALARATGLDLVWVLFGKGPPPWELTEEHRRILWLAEIVGHEAAAARLAAAQAPGGIAEPVARIEETEAVRRQLRQSSRREATTKGPISRSDQPDSEEKGERSHSKRDIQR